MANNLPQAVPPNLPLAQNTYDPASEEHFSRVLRLFFNRLTSTFNKLLGTRGGQYLSSPFGAYSRLTSFAPALANTAYLVGLTTVDFENGTTMDGADGIHVQQNGLYNYQFSVQFQNTDPNSADATIWLRKNGVDHPHTASVFSIPGKHGSVNGALIGVANFFVGLNAGDYIEMWWASETTTVSIAQLAAQTSPFARPASPAVVVTLSYVSALE